MWNPFLPVIKNRNCTYQAGMPYPAWSIRRRPLPKIPLQRCPGHELLRERDYAARELHGIPASRLRDSLSTWRDRIPDYRRMAKRPLVSLSCGVPGPWAPSLPVNDELTMPAAQEQGRRDGRCSHSAVLTHLHLRTERRISVLTITDGRIPRL